MSKNCDSQLSLDLPVPPKIPHAPSAINVENNARINPTDSYAPVISFSDKKAAKDKDEIAKHLFEILHLVRHFK